MYTDYVGKKTALIKVKSLKADCHLSDMVSLKKTVLIIKQIFQ
jgi:hypothetical protein